MKQLTYLLIALIYALTSFPAWAGCADLGSATKWSRIDNHKIIMYRGSSALALLDIPSCSIRSSADIRLVKEDVCSGDKIIIDGEVCDIRSVERL